MFKKPVLIHYDKEFISNKELDDRLLLVMAYLRIRASMKGIVGTTLENIVKGIGYAPNRNNGRINDIILDQLRWLHRNGHIEISLPFNKITPKEYIEISIDVKNNLFQMTHKDDEEKISPYVTLTDREFSKITTTKTRANKGILLRVFLNIKKKINYKKNEPKICYPSQTIISRDCNKTSGYTINNAIKELVDMKVLYMHVTGGYKDKNGNIKNANNVYAIDPNELKNANQKILEYYNNDLGIKIDSFMPIDNCNS